MGYFQYFQDSEFLELIEFQYFQESGILKWVGSSISRIQSSQNGFFSVFPGFRVTEMNCFPIVWNIPDLI